MTGKQDALVGALLDRHGQTFSAELGIDLGANTPSPLFRWLCATLLLSARISSDLAVRGAAALAEQGWTTADKLHDTTWQERVKVLNRSGYARYDEKTSAMLGDLTTKILDDYGGDLRKLRERAERDPDHERALITEFKGIGDVGADIFFREAQIAWDEHFPFADERALEAADRFGLPGDAKGLAGLVERDEFPALVAALIRADIAGEDADALLQAADAHD